MTEESPTTPITIGASREMVEGLDAEAGKVDPAEQVLADLAARHGWTV